MCTIIADTRCSKLWSVIYCSNNMAIRDRERYFKFIFGHLPIINWDNYLYVNNVLQYLLMKKITSPSEQIKLVSWNKPLLFLI